MQLLGELNPEQRRSVEHTAGPLVIVAGAGTGKTTVITRRIAWLIDQKLAKPDEILAMTFTDKAAGEMEERVDQLLPYGYLDLWVLTFHAFCERILKDHALDIGLSPQFKLLDQTGAWLLTRQHLQELNLEYYRPLGNPTKFLDALINHFSRAKDEDLSPEVYLEYAEGLTLDADAPSEFPLERKRTSDATGVKISEAARIHELARAFHAYEQLLLKNNCLDFGGLISMTLKLFRSRPQILKKYQQQFKYILVDEFQDTNYAQYELIKMLASDDSNITVVADDDQSIYAFRSASISNILEFKKDFPSAKEVVLTSNYRSPQNILDLAYHFIQHNNPNRLEAQWKEAERSPEAETEEQHLREEIQQKGKMLSTKISKQLTSQHEEPGVIEHLHFTTLEEEVNAVVDRIGAMQQSEKASWNDFAILVRANATAEPFIHRLELSGIPYQFVASKGLFLKSPIIDLLAVLKCTDQWYDSRSLYRVLSMAAWKLASDQLMLLTHLASRKGISLAEVLHILPSVKGLSDQTLQTLEKVASLLKRLGSHAKRGKPSAILLDFLHESGLFERLSVSKDDPEVYDHINLYNQFLKLVQNFERNHLDATVHTFLEEVEMMIESGEQGSLAPSIEEGPESVKVLTVHAAKGLEFPHVFIVNVVDKRFPSVSRPDPLPIPDDLVKEIVPEGDLHLQEERRLFYVAMTRAKQSLFFTSSEEVGGSRKKKVSRFLLEAGLVAEARPVVKNPPPPSTRLERIPRHLPKMKLAQFTSDSFSFTQLKSFETCPWQYYLGFVLKVPRPGSASMSFGRTLHNTLHTFFTQRQERVLAGINQGSLFVEESSDPTPPASSPSTLEALLKIYEEAWIDEWYPNAQLQEEFKAKGKAILKDFFALHEDHWPQPTYMEKGFRLKLGTHTIKGVIDRVDPFVESGKPTDGIEIMDYKTGKVPSSAKGIDWSQLILYAIAADEAMGETPKRLTFYYLFENKPFSKEVEKADLVRIKIWAEELISAILKGDFRATPGHHCGYCDYKTICEFRK